MSEFYVLSARARITASNNVIRFKEGGGATLSATIIPGSYYLFGGGVDADDLLRAIELAMEAAGAETYTHTYLGRITGATGDVELTGSDSFQIVASDAAHTFPMSLLGFPEGVDTASSDELNSTLSPSHTWLSDEPPVLTDLESVDGQVARHAGPQGHRSTFIVGDEVEMRRLEFELVAADRTLKRKIPADPARTFQAFHSIIRDGRPIRLYATATSAATFLPTLTSADLIQTYSYEEDPSRFAPVRLKEAALYSWDIGLVEHIE